MAASVRDVADEAGVSVGTVSNVLNRPGIVSPATAAKVHAAVEKLGFVRNDAARQLRAGRSRSFGQVVIDARNPFFMDVAHGAQRRALDDGYSVLLGGSDGSSDREKQLLDIFEEHRVAGVLISPVQADLSRLFSLRNAGIPVVLVDRETTDYALPSVAVDDVEGGRIATRHLFELGRTRIAFVGGPDSIKQVADRLRGAQEILSASRSAALTTYWTTELSVLEGRRIGEEIAQLRPQERPDAVFAANDLLALGLLQALVMTGSIHVPDDIAIIGYDDIDFAQAAVVPLSSVRQPASEIGRTGVDLLIREAAGEGEALPQQVLFTPEIVVRDSTLGKASDA